MATRSTVLSLVLATICTSSVFADPPQQKPEEFVVPLGYDLASYCSKLDTDYLAEYLKERDTSEKLPFYDNVGFITTETKYTKPGECHADDQGRTICEAPKTVVAHATPAEIAWVTQASKILGRALRATSDEELRYPVSSKELAKLQSFVTENLKASGCVECGANVGWEQTIGGPQLRIFSRNPKDHTEATWTVWVDDLVSSQLRAVDPASYVPSKRALAMYSVEFPVGAYVKGRRAPECRKSGETWISVAGGVTRGMVSPSKGNDATLGSQGVKEPLQVAPAR